MTTHRCEKACRGYCVRPLNKSEAFRSASDFLAGEQHPGLACVVVDMRMPGLNGMDLLNGLIQRHREEQLVFITGHGNETSHRGGG
jgi:FixJ family two-component response regulator